MYDSQLPITGVAVITIGAVAIDLWMVAVALIILGLAMIAAVRLRDRMVGLD